VASVAGVREVQDDIGVFPSSKLDDGLRERIGRAIYGNAGFWHYAMLPNPSIHIIVEGSRVTLRGVVRTDLDRTMAQALAMQCNALSVTNELKTIREIGDSLDRLE
jgi:osmotically-inducible protein OsmY